jgi:hypothetical protein
LIALEAAKSLTITGLGWQEFELRPPHSERHAPLGKISRINKLLVADQMQGVLTRIDANGVCDRSGCLI